MREKTEKNFISIAREFNDDTPNHFPLFLSVLLFLAREFYQLSIPRIS